ncbi:MAG TPA: hypothetical protein PKH09_01295 [Parvularculaceae bacterium]|nr:hypothetical protein [Parvularculaceae bacterium]
MNPNSEREHCVQEHAGRLKIAEQQFRLAATVNLAVTNGVQTLDVPVKWTFGQHSVRYEDFGLRPDQAPLAAACLEHTAVLAMSGVIRDAIVALFEDPKNHSDSNVVGAYQISRLVRNAFAHSFVAPTWSIDKDCRSKTFEIRDVIRLDTTELQNQPMQWPHYGGPLAIFKFGRFVRETLLGDKVDPLRETPPYPTLECYQLDRVVVRKIDHIPEGAVEVMRAGPGERIDFGDRHYLEVRSNDDAEHSEEKS